MLYFFFFALCYIFSLTSHWGFDLIFVLHPPRIVVLHHLILLLRCFLIFTTFADQCGQKQSRSMIAIISMCSVLMIFFFFFFLINWMCYINFLPRTKKELLLLSMLYIFWVSVYVCKGWFGNCKSCSDSLAKCYPPLTLPLQVCVCKGLIIFFVVIFIPTLKPCL